jgi:hypothetical protein
MDTNVHYEPTRASEAWIDQGVFDGQFLVRTRKQSCMDERELDCNWRTAIHANGKLPKDSGHGLGQNHAADTFIHFV